MTPWIRYLPLIGLVFLITACGVGPNPVGTIADVDPTTANVEPLTVCLKPGKDGGEREVADEEIEALIEGVSEGADAGGARGGSSLLNQFLDCAVGNVAKNDIELRLLRGHIVVAMLAQYGAFNITFAGYREKKEDATALLAQIERAERLLKDASKVVTGKAPPETATPTVDTLRRVSAILELSLVAQRPTVARVRNFALTVAAAVSGAPGAIGSAVKEGLRGIRKLAKIELWGNAYRQDSQTFLAQFSGPGAKTLEKKHWDLWNREIESACAILAVVASVQHHCIPQ